MGKDRLIEMLVALHEGLPRLGPGNAESTLRALALCKDLPTAPAVLDVGCGTGAQTLLLSFVTGCRVTATDLFSTFLVQLVKAAAELGIEKRIQALQADMGDLPFRNASFDLIWSEGAVYNIGFDNALMRWRPLARPRAYLVVSELSWLRPDPPAEPKDFWDRYYPAMRGVDENLVAARNGGWAPVGNFQLPVAGWTEYYEPLKKRIPAFRRSHSHDREARALADMTEYEMSLMSRYAEFVGYAFYVLRRVESVPRQGTAGS